MREKEPVGLALMPAPKGSGPALRGQLHFLLHELTASWQRKSVVNECVQCQFQRS